MLLTGENELFGDKPVTVTLCPNTKSHQPGIEHGPPW